MRVGWGKNIKMLIKFIWHLRVTLISKKRSQSFWVSKNQNHKINRSTVKLFLNFARAKLKTMKIKVLQNLHVIFFSDFMENFPFCTHDCKRPAQSSSTN